MQSRPHCAARLAKASKTVLIVDDVVDLLDSLVMLLQAEGYEVVSAADGESALRVIHEKEIDLVVLDHRMPKKSGAEVAQMLNQSGPTRPRIAVHSAVPEGEIRRMWDGYDDFLEKPCPPDRLLASVAALLEVERRASIPTSMPLVGDRQSSPFDIGSQSTRQGALRRCWTRAVSDDVLPIRAAGGAMRWNRWL